MCAVFRMVVLVNAAFEVVGATGVERGIGATDNIYKVDHEEIIS